MVKRVQLLLLLWCVAQAQRCEPWCVNACTDLNGDIESECGGCDATDPQYMCHPEHESYKNFDSEAAQQQRKKALAETQREDEQQASDAFVDLDWQPTQPETGTCEFATIVQHAEVNRTWLLAQQAPLLIKGATEGWAGKTKWTRQSMLEVYGEAAYHLETSGPVSLGLLLAHKGRYNMGHMVFPEEDCYANRYRPYSPFLNTTAADYIIPEYLKPMRTFQMGIGVGEGIGVPPENHPGAWFAAVVGRKRWMLAPPGLHKPPGAMQNAPKCALRVRASTMQLCDQQEGDMLWVPDFWWHETCGLDDYSVGIGGITYEGAGDTQGNTGQCNQQGEYRMSDIPHCKEHKCPGLGALNAPSKA